MKFYAMIISMMPLSIIILIRTAFYQSTLYDSFFVENSLISGLHLFAAIISFIFLLIGVVSVIKLVNKSRGASVEHPKMIGNMEEVTFESAGLYFTLLSVILLDLSKWPQWLLLAFLIVLIVMLSKLYTEKFLSVVLALIGYKTYKLVDDLSKQDKSDESGQIANKPPTQYFLLRGEYDNTTNYCYCIILSNLSLMYKVNNGKSRNKDHTEQNK